MGTFTALVLVGVVCVCVLLLPGSKGASDHLMQSAVLRGHNMHRANAGLESVKWSHELEQSASKYASELAQSYQCTQIRPSGVKSSGENIWMSREATQRPHKSTLASLAVQQWYQQLEFYQYPGHGNFLGCQGVAFSRVHDLTQLMWEKTTQVGCGAHTCANGYSVFVCHYHPPGNQLGQSLFTQEHFLNLCRYEGGLWKSCDKELQTICRDPEEFFATTRKHVPLIVKEQPGDKTSKLCASLSLMTLGALISYTIA